MWFVSSLTFFPLYPSPLELGGNAWDLGPGTGKLHWGCIYLGLEDAFIWDIFMWFAVSSVYSYS